MHRLKNLHTLKLILPIILLGLTTGTLTGALVSVYRFLAKHAISLSESLYGFIREHLIYLLIVVPALVTAALILRFVYKKMPTLQGGGISQAMGLVAGLFSFRWLSSLIGTVTLSLSNFVFGAVLGNEGPSVLIGASVGEASTRLFGKKAKSWSRYSIAAGASSGFSAATGGPMTGIVFSIEEMHRRLSPMIIMISLVSVGTCRAVMEFLCPLLEIDVALFSGLDLPVFSVSKFYVPLLIALSVGLFSVCFLSLFVKINRFVNETLKKLDAFYKVFAVLAMTLVFGLISFSFVSTGHHLTQELIFVRSFSFFLLLLLLVRSLLTLFSTSSGLTGGLFLPTLAISALISSLVAHGLICFGLVESEYYTLSVVLGIVAGMAGIMNMPFTAIVFSLEVLGCYQNLLSVVLVCAVSFAIVELFHCKSINELALEKRIHSERKGKISKTVERDVVVQKGAFAVGKEIKDVFWPANLTVLSVTHPQGEQRYGGYLSEGDVLRVNYTTWDEKSTEKELFAIVGENV